MTFFDQISDTLIETMMYHSELDYMEYHLSEITKITMEKCKKCSKCSILSKNTANLDFLPQFENSSQLSTWDGSTELWNVKITYITERNIFKYEITAE